MKDCIYVCSVTEDKALCMKERLLNAKANSLSRRVVYLSPRCWSLRSVFISPPKSSDSSRKISRDAAEEAVGTNHHARKALAA